MIGDTKPQNMIVVITIIAALIGSFSLGSSTGYYAGSYVMVTYLDVRLENVTLAYFDPASFDPTNDSLEPSFRLTFRFLVPEGIYGKASITSLTSTATLNGESFDYISFFRNVPAADRALYAGYNKTIGVSATVGETADRELLWNATQTDTWNFIFRLTVFYRPFESRADSVRHFIFAYEGYSPA